MEIIGEASVHISKEIKIKFREIEWGQIKGMRNSYMHEYFGIDSKLVWEIINYDLPKLKTRVVHILVYLSENQDF
ncbi:HepT-like ribonuclease domain-containing protein [Cyclobacterium lianum]|uniref:HepT-like ribonuclease domain-containing protein n=1 Tax=Cyclobacterium lianum TaxID=388280 RepID=UPI0009FCC81F